MYEKRWKLFVLLLIAAALLWGGRSVPASAGGERGVMGALRQAYVEQPKAMLEALAGSVRPSSAPAAAPRVQQAPGPGSISVSIGPITSNTALTFLQQPGKGAHGFTLDIQPTVAVQQGGSVATGDNSTVVTLRVQPGSGAPGAAITCAGGLSRIVTAGVAAFSGCKIDLKSDGYVLEALADGALSGQTALFSVGWTGDASGNCEVDIVDFSVLVRSFFRPPSDPAFDRRADINLDNQVDILDFSLLKSMFGTRCPALTLLPASGGGGASVTVSGTAFVPNRDVAVALDGAEVAATTTDGDGAFTASVTIPAGSAVGDHVIKASQVNGRVLAGAVFTVQPPS